MALIAFAIVYAALATASSPWTDYIRVFTAIPALWAIWYAVRRGWHRRVAETPPIRVNVIGVAGLMVWTVLFTVLAVWILAVFFSHPRAEYPTVSYLLNIAFRNYPIRVGGFTAWLAAGWYLLRR
jgi:hypothetical protein